MPTPYRPPELSIRVESKNIKNRASGNLTTKNSKIGKLEVSGQKHQTKKSQIGLDQELNDDIQQVFREDEDILQTRLKQNVSRISQLSSRENQDFQSFWKNDASRPLFDDDTLYRKLEKERQAKIDAFNEKKLITTNNKNEKKSNGRSTS